MWKATKAVYDWLIRRPGYMLLTASQARLAAEDPNRFRYAWWELMLASVLWSLASVVIWGAAWAVFRDQIWLLMPAAVTTTVFALWPYRNSILALAEALGGRDAAGRSLAATLVVLLLCLSLAAMRGHIDWYKGGLPAWIAWVLPDYVTYRILALMPLWGGWAMLVPGQFCRKAADAEPAVTAMYARAGAMVTAGTMGVILAVTILFLRHTAWTQATVSASAIATAVIGGMVLCRLLGGLRRSTLLAVNVLTQLAFLLGYLASS